MISKLRIKNLELRTLHSSFFILHSRKGYALLLAVVIVSTVLSTATALASIVISGIRQTRSVADALIARAVAESDIEQSLFILRKSEPSYLTTTNYDIEGAHITRTVTTAASSPLYIPENDFITLPLTPTANPDPMRITAWVPDDSCASGESWIEVSTVEWDAQNGLITNSERNLHPYTEYVSGSSPMPPISLPLYTTEVRVRALHCPIKQFGVNLATHLIVHATAGFHGVQQSSEITVPRVEPVSGLFDFAIFSECQITKGIDGGSC